MGTIYSGHSKPKNMSVMAALQNTKDETVNANVKSGLSKAIFSVKKAFKFPGGTPSYNDFQVGLKIG